MPVPSAQPFDKETIRYRILKNAAHFWGLKNADALDPMIRLLVEAFATELQNAHHEIQNAEVRILDKLARLLTPDLLIAPRPAHAIAHIRPEDSGQLLSVRHQYFSPKKIARRKDDIVQDECQIVFSPVDHVKLVNGDITYIASGNRLYPVDNTTGQRITEQSVLLSGQLPYGEVWIGLDLPEEDNLSNLCFYLDWSFSRESWQHNMLSLTHWSFNGQELDISTGYPYHDDLYEKDVPDLFKDHDQIQMIEEDVKTIYHNHFVTIKNIAAALQSHTGSSLPDAVRQLFPAVVSKGAQDPSTVWLCIRFPAMYTPDLLQDLRISINAFPVINRKLITLHHIIRPFNKIIPLTAGFQEFFLAMHEVSDGTGTPYIATPGKREHGVENGSYSIRFGGAERFDGRNAHEMIQYLLELLRDEVAAFSAFGKDFIEGIIKELNIRMRMLEIKAKDDKNRHIDTPTYLVIEPHGSDHNMELLYWLTNGELANNIRAGNELLKLQTSLSRTGPVTLYTATSGGKQRILPQDRLDAYRYALTTRNRLVTAEDIRNFCFYYLGSRLKNVTLKKGLASGIDARTGWMRTTDIVLELHNTGTPEDGSLICTALLELIKRRSPDSIHYRVMVA